MELELDGWRFLVHVESTRMHTANNALEHCVCSYCKNYYETVGFVYPQLSSFLNQFGIDVQGPSELMPFSHDYLLACYRVQGKILEWGRQELFVNGIPVVPEAADENTFFLWIGEMELPWVQNEDPSEVISPANLPEFLERMQEVWQLRHGGELIFS